MRCLIVDDSAPFLAAAERFLQSDGITIVGVASTGVEGLSSYEALRPDITLVDIDLGGESGFELAERLVAAGAVVVLISTHAAQDFDELIERSPAAGFLGKSELTPAAIRELLARSSSVEEGKHR